jgi:hypothetical protein
MAELIVIGPAATDLRSDDPGVSMNLHCWPCRTVHEFGLDDVERIVYALGGIAADDFNRIVSEPDCLISVLRGASDSEAYAEHVDQGVECRQANRDAGAYVHRRCCGTPVGDAHLGWCVLPVEEPGPPIGIRPPPTVGERLDAERRGESPFYVAGADEVPE